jgi:CelD/BcsL family acetyltransferase involved in cellulose biosynthesis
MSKSETLALPFARDSLALPMPGLRAPRPALRPAEPPALAPLDTSRVEAMLLGRVQAAEHVEAWRELALRALERNVFYEPDFALAAAMHLSHTSRPLFLFLWDTTLAKDEPGALLGLFPLTMPRSMFGPTEIYGWRHEQISLGTPLVDARFASETIAAFFTWLAGRGCAGILLPSMAEDGEVAAAIRAVAARSGRRLRSFDPHERAVLSGSKAGVPFVPAGTGAAMPAGPSAKRQKDLKRLARRMADHVGGPVELEQVSDPEGLHEATEIFMALEASGWKGRQGTAFVQDHGAATFLRTLTRALARSRECRIDILRAGGKPVAAAIILKAGANAWYWKTAFDEEFAAFSPGVQITSALTRQLQEDSAIALTDSCAIPDHPMIDALWPQRLRISDWLVPAKGEPSAALTMVAARQTAKRRLRAAAKEIYHSLHANKRRS